MHTVLLPVHIVAGGLAIVLGDLALLVAKGGGLHRQSGILFVYAMLTMGISGSTLALHNGFDPNVIVGLTSAYFVITALTTVRPATGWTHRLNIGAAVLALALTLFELGLV